MEGLWKTRCVVPDLESRLVPEGAINSSVLAAEKEDTKGAALLTAKQDADKKKKQNRLALNRVRCVMITLVVLFHAGLCFESGTAWASLAPDLERDYMAYLNIFIGRSGWPMDVFFTLAGYAAFHSLRVRSVTDFMIDRSLRLVPSITFGLLVLNPLTWYLWYALSQVIDNLTGAWSEYTGFWDLYLHLYVDCFSGNERCSAGGFCVQHMWYLIYLYLFCLLGLPIFLLWKKFTAPRIDTSAKKVLVAASFFALPILIWGTDLLWYLQPDLPVLRVFSKRNFLEYFIYIFFGYFLAWCDDAHEILLSLTYFFTGVAVALIPALPLAGLVRDGTSAGKWGSIWERLLVVISAKATMYAVWGLAHKLFPHLPRMMGRCFDYVADRAIAVYVLNNILIVCVEAVLYYACAGTFLATYTVPRFLLMFVLTYGLFFAVYESLFRWKYTKPLVGMMRGSDLGPKKEVQTKGSF